MKNKRYILTGVFALAISSLIFVNSSLGKPPLSEEDLKLMNEELINLVKKGDELWHSEKLGTNGLSCANCHPDAANSNPHTFPKFQENVGKVATLREMINWCIQIPLEGKTLPEDSEEMKALEAYSIYMYRGFKLKPGDNQKAYPPVEVKEGAGYP
ncbi:MAG: cytochrome C [Aquificae bacterium]|nr:cytochrome C [Aquificota bacterium]